MSKKTDAELRRILPHLIKIRRQIHRNPESAYKEFKTAELVEGELVSAGIPAKRVGKTGVVGLLSGKRPGPTIGLRADIDALNLKELTGLPYASVNDCMHACGHDGHTTMLIGAAKMLAGQAGRIAGKVKFIFQPAEEGGAGAKQLCDLGVMQRPKVSAMFALHCFNSLPVGAIGIKDGVSTTCADKYTIKITGKGAHGASPELSIDPIVIAAKIVDGLQTIVSREIDPRSAAVVTVGVIRGGTAENIIPETAEIIGTLRSFDPAVREHVVAAVRRIATKTAAAMRGKATVKMGVSFPSVVNDKTMADIVRKVGKKVLKPGKVAEIAQSTMGAEDFSFYLQHAPGAFFRLGTGNGKADQAPAHNPYFDFNDKAIVHGVRMLVGIVDQMLR